MLELAPLILTYGAMALYLITLFLLVVVIKRTRGNFRTVLIIFAIIMFISIIRRTLNVLNLSEIFNNEIWDDSFAILTSAVWLVSIYILFREIRGLTDVEVHHTKEARLPPPKRTEFNAFERPEKRFENDGAQERRRLRVVNGYVDFTKEE